MRAGQDITCTQGSCWSHRHCYDDSPWGPHACISDTRSASDLRSPRSLVLPGLRSTEALRKAGGVEWLAITTSSVDTLDRCLSHVWLYVVSSWSF